MDVCVIAQETLLGSMPEVCTVVDGCNFRRCSSEDLWLPGIEMGIEVNDRDRTVGAVYGSQERECNGMIASESDDTRKSLAML